MMETQVLVMPSPIGRLTLAGSGDVLARIWFADEDGPRATDRVSRALRDAASQLEAYFAGRRWTFQLELAARGTGFQRAVWSEVVRIAPGSTESYRAIAARIGRPRASRAVGSANGANPIPIVVPCHRVIGASGALTGYAGGLARKRWLLQHESRSTGDGSLPLGQ